MDFTNYLPVAHDDDYWTHDIPLFVGKFRYYRNKPRMVQGRVHVADEQYVDVNQEIVPIARPDKGSRTYINMQPYVLEPQVFMNVGLYPEPKQYADQPEAIGETVSTYVKGMQQRQLGNAQAWYYPADQTICVWECFFDAGIRQHPLTEDRQMKQLWIGFEQWLMKQFPEATRIVTPFHDPIARSSEEYQTFLRALGYESVAQAAFGKSL